MQHIPCKCNAKDKLSNPDVGTEFGLVMWLFFPALAILISLCVGYEPQNTVARDVFTLIFIMIYSGVASFLIFYRPQQTPHQPSCPLSETHKEWTNTEVVCRSILKFLLISFGLCFIWIEIRTIFGQSSQNNGAGANIVLYINFANSNETHKDVSKHGSEREISTTALQEILNIFSKAIDWSKVLEGIENGMEVAFGKKGGKKIVIHL
ncbi:hypothetical protein V866_000639 [Kwoniella sp. B9012]